MKKRVIKEYNNLPLEVKEAINVEYPDGIEDGLKSMQDIKGNYFQGMTFEFGDVVYLVKYTDESKLLVSSDDDDDDDDDNTFDDDDARGSDDEWMDDDY